MVKRILVATDLSPGSDEALRQAAACAQATDAHVAVCHVFPSSLASVPFFAPNNEPAVAEASALRSRAFELLAQQVAEAMPNTKAEVIAEEGNAHAGIVRFAETWQADLVVVGARGRTALSRMPLGSVAEQVVRHAHCSVLVARPGVASGIVLAATDLSNPSLPAVAAGAAEARRRNAKLVVTHAVDFASVKVSLQEMAIGAFEPNANWNLDNEVRDQVTRELHKALEHCGAVGTTYVTTGPAAAAVVRYAEELGAELLVIGARGRTGLLRLVLGSVAERIISTAGCSVLAVRQA
ncbi:MAG: universal stress protein [Polyangiaceae bacterium]